MGNFLCFKTHMLDPYRSYSRLSLEHIQKKLLGRFLQLQERGVLIHGGPDAKHQSGSRGHRSSLSPTPLSSGSSSSSSTSGNFGWSIDFHCFHRLFPLLSLEEAVERFKLWDDDADGVVDLLELLSALIFLSSSSFSSKLRALFDLFHFSDSPGGLSAEEMSNLVQRWSKAAERVLGTERMKERYEAEMDEVAKRAMVHLTFDLPSAISRPAHHLHPSINLLTGKPQVEVSFKRFEIFCGVTPMLLQAFTRHGTTDGEETKTYWTGVLGQPGTQVYLDARNRYGVSSVALANFKELREEAQRIHASFRHWIPLHRHLLNYRANHAQAHGGGAGGGAEEKLQGGKGGAGMSVLVTSPSSAMSPTRASAAGASPVSSPNRRPASSGLSTPSSPMLGGAVNAAASSSSSSSAAASSSASSSLPLLPPPSHLPTPSLAHLDEMLPISPAQVALGDVQSKWKDNTASSKARGVKKKHVSSHTQTAKDKLAAHLALLEAKHAAQHAAGGMMGGHGGGGPGGMMQMNPHAAAVAKKVAEATKLDDGRNRPAYLAIRRIKAKVQSRRDKSDPAFQHFVYDHQTLRQAKHLFDQIDTDQSGEITIQELTTNMDSNEYLGAAISAFKSLDIDATGTIDFSELLRALFPLATTHHVKLMCVEVKAIELVKKDIETLQKIFEWLDEDFDGRVLFRELLAYLRDETTDNARGTSQARKKYARDYIPTRSIYELKEDDRLMNFLEAMCELFSQSHAHMIQDVKKWASRLDVAALTDKQHTELEQLFDLYDADGSGSVSLEELEAHFTNLGFTEDDNARMFKMMDRDSGGEVDITEFKRFYRSVYRP